MQNNIKDFCVPSTANKLMVNNTENQKTNLELFCYCALCSSVIDYCMDSALYVLLILRTLS